MSDSVFLPRRRLLGVGAAALAVSSSAAADAQAAAPAPASNEARHKLVYQINHPEQEYQEAILNSIGAVLRKYVDDVAIAVVVWGPGIHLLAKQPKRPVNPVHQQRARDMRLSYGVDFIACGNTMHALGWDKADMLDFARVEDVGAAALMELQEKGYAYIAW